MINIDRVASLIASRIPEMARDSVIKNTQIIRDLLEEERFYRDCEIQTLRASREAIAEQEQLNRVECNRLREKLALVKKPCYCLGRHTVETVAREGQLQTDEVDFVAADDLFHADVFWNPPATPWVRITVLRALVTYYKARLFVMRCEHCGQRFGRHDLSILHPPPKLS